MIGLFVFLIFLALNACRENRWGELLLSAGDALRAGNVEKALFDYNRVVTLNPDSVASQEALYWIGEIYRLFKNKPEEGIGFFRKAVSLGVRSPYAEKAQKSIAETYIQDLKDYKKAVPELQFLIDRFPKSELAGESQYQIGQCYLAIGEYEQARIEYGLLLERYPTSEYCDDAAYRICETYYREGDVEHARLKYKEFLNRYPKSFFVVNAHLELASLLEESGQYDEALNHLVLLEQKYPNKEIILRKVDRLLKKKNTLDSKVHAGKRR